MRSYQTPNVDWWSEIDTKRPIRFRQGGPSVRLSQFELPEQPISPPLLVRSSPAP